MILISYFVYHSYYHWVLGLYFYLFSLIIPYRIIPKYHRLGIENMKKQKFNEAYNDFEMSLIYFNKYKILDIYGFILLLNISDYTYRESALINQARIKLNLNDKIEAEKLYIQALKINPKNRIAKKGLELMHSK